MRKRYLVILMMHFAFSAGYSQAPLFAFGLWKQQSLSGALSLEGRHRQQVTVLRPGIAEWLRMSLLLGELKLSSQSYIWLPSLLNLNVDLDYKPSTRRSIYLVLPDRGEVRTTENGRVQAILLKSKPVSLRLFTNYSHSFTNRDYLTNVETFKNDYGGSVFVRYKFLPVSVTCQQNRWNQKELQTGRLFTNNSRKFQGKISKSFTPLDDLQLSYSFNDLERNYANIWQVKSKISSIDLRNKIHFKEKNPSNLYSLVQSYRQSGSINFNRFQIYESLFIKLPKNLQFNSSYQFSKNEQEKTISTQNNIASRLEHQLYSSLRTQLYHEYTYQKQFQYNELLNSGGINFYYRKKTPIGLLSLHYDFQRRHQNRSSTPILLRVFNEEHELTDGQPILLNRPYIVPNSLVVTDQTETIIYQENIDYLIIKRANYLELQRLPGGHIRNGMTVYTNYQTIQQNSYKFDIVNRSFSVSIKLFRRMLELYYRSLEQDYRNIHLSDTTILKYISQSVYGGRLSLGFLSGGIEKNNFDSNIIPYQLRRYYIQLYGNIIADKIMLSLTGNRREYWMTMDKEQQLFSDISGKIVWNISFQTKTSFEGGYRYQEGRGLDLKLLTGRFEFYTKYRQLILTFGVEVFRRLFYQEKNNYDGFYIRLERKF
ncbi:MAG: hypothetical protein GXO75_15280 [Calditrichaeota bacterium]|nr:hypothetical protein [Calditrichota bacterium]